MITIGQLAEYAGVTIRAVRHYHKRGLLDDLRAIGLSDRYLRIERDLWILLCAVRPKEAAERLADRRDALADPDLRGLILDFDRAFAAEPGDPALAELAARMIDVTVRRYGPDVSAWAENTGFQGLMQTALVGVSPAWDETYRILREWYEGSAR